MGGTSMGGMSGMSMGGLGGTQKRTFWENIARYFIIYYAFFLLMGFISNIDYSRTKNDEARLQSIFAKNSRRLR